MLYISHCSKEIDAHYNFNTVELHGSNPLGNGVICKSVCDHKIMQLLCTHEIMDSINMLVDTESLSWIVKNNVTGNINNTLDSDVIMDAELLGLSLNIRKSETMQHSGVLFCVPYLEHKLSLSRVSFFRATHRAICQPLML